MTRALIPLIRIAGAVLGAAWAPLLCFGHFGLAVSAFGCSGLLMLLSYLYEYEFLAVGRAG